ncbi:MAG: GNAT family N-acetyltransferase [Acidimicrobiia bacterium]|nr:GNAT family N-acetyltransferase [Acidimicrobiia bacterium]
MTWARPYSAVGSGYSGTGAGIIATVSDVIRNLEELSFRTLPALEQERYDGWVLRWSDGGSRRSNSVNPVSSSTSPLAEKVEYCEDWFNSRRAAAIFRITPLADDALRDFLTDRGYSTASPTDVMTAAITNPLRVRSVLITDRPSSHWLRLITGLGAESPESQQLASQLGAGDGLLRFASTGTDHEVLAVGMSVDLDAFTTIYHMKTDSVARRRGLAASILNTLLAVGQQSGSTHAVLQVTQDNMAAQSLYRQFGFTPAYEYAYMKQAAQP